MITLPLESTITLSKVGITRTEHTTFVTGEPGQAFAESVAEFLGGSAREAVEIIDAQNSSQQKVV